MAHRAIAEGAIAAARGAGRRRCALARNATERLRRERVDLVRSSESGVVDYPESAVLLPREALQEIVLGVNVITERFGAEESVYITTVGKLAKNLRHHF
jgi:hypothetical protein